MPYRIAGIDVHKKMLAVVVADVSSESDFHFERHKVGTSPADLHTLADWLVECEVDEVVMESTAQYWRPVWEALERYWRPARRTREDASPLSGTLHLAQAQSNRGAGGRKKDFPDAERLVKRLVAQELTLSFVPDAEQRLWRTVMRRKYQITRNRVQLHNRLESLLEEAHIKLSSLVSDLLGTSARRMLQALADGETNAAAVASLADSRLRATTAQLADAFSACTALHPVYRRLLKLTLEELRVIEDHLAQLDQQMADLLAAHHEAVQRLAEVPGLGVDSAQQIIAEVGATAATFPSPKHLASWMGACPGNEESAGKNYSHRCPKGNRQMRRLLNQAANAAVKAKGTIFAIVYRRLVPRLGHAQAIGAIAHRLCRLIWKILHQGIRYEERGPAVSEEAKRVRARKMIRELRTLGYRVELAPTTEPASPAIRQDRSSSDRPRSEPLPTFPATQALSACRVRLRLSRLRRAESDSSTFETRPRGGDIGVNTSRARPVIAPSHLGQDANSVHRAVAPGRFRFGRGQASPTWHSARARKHTFTSRQRATGKQERPEWTPGAGAVITFRALGGFLYDRDGYRTPPVSPRNDRR